MYILEFQDICNLLIIQKHLHTWIFQKYFMYTNAWGSFKLLLQFHADFWLRWDHCDFCGFCDYTTGDCRWHKAPGHDLSHTYNNMNGDTDTDTDWRQGLLCNKSIPPYRGSTLCTKCNFKRGSYSSAQLNK